MKSLTWESGYEIGDHRVDQQHHRLFDLYAAVTELTPGNLDRDRLLHDLYAYAVFHFAEEESLMATEGYPAGDRQAHEDLHASFLSDLARLRGESAEEALAFFANWLVNHILVEDRRIGDFLANRGFVP